MSNKNSGNSLLLGMVFATEQRAKRGQEYRDRVRCEAMESIGFQVKTLDNKHSDAKLDKHCTANFSDTRRMMKSMDAKWSGEKFDHVILDYFFSPVRICSFHCASIDASNLRFLSYFSFSCILY